MKNEELVTRVVDEVRLSKQTENFASRMDPDVMKEVSRLSERFNLSKGKVFEAAVRLFAELVFPQEDGPLHTHPSPPERRSGRLVQS